MHVKVSETTRDPVPLPKTNSNRIRTPPCRQKPKERLAVHSTSLETMLTGSNSKSSNLIRVRNNQRRSRARRREYVAELERKVQEYNAHGLPPCAPDVDPQNTILQLKEENRKLRELLALAGVEQALVNTHLAAETAEEKLVSLESGNNNLLMLPSC